MSIKGIDWHMIHNFYVLAQKSFLLASKDLSLAVLFLFGFLKKKGSEETSPAHHTSEGQNSLAQLQNPATTLHPHLEIGYY